MITVLNILKWASIPVLLTASLFACCTARYELAVDFAVCVSAIFFVQRAIRMDEYFRAAGFVAIGMAFTPLALALKILLLAGFTCVAAFAKLLSIYRMQPDAAFVAQNAMTENP